MTGLVAAPEAREEEDALGQAPARQLLRDAQFDDDRPRLDPPAALEGDLTAARSGRGRHLRPEHRCAPHVEVPVASGCRRERGPRGLRGGVGRQRQCGGGLPRAGAVRAGGAGGARIRRRGERQCKCERDGCVGHSGLTRPGSAEDPCSARCAVTFGDHSANARGDRSLRAEREGTWRGQDSNLRRQSQRVYSASPLTAREPRRGLVSLRAGARCP